MTIPIMHRSLYTHVTTLLNRVNCVPQNVQLRRCVCKSQLQRMAAEQDLQSVCHALIATRLRVQELKNAGNTMMQVSPLLRNSVLVCVH